ncbi:MAG: DUF2927 domain-containing protein [Marinibacterium sp.]|nr:DUF2927 domain-containing protein [Marinibacterium sp.]
MKIWAPLILAGALAGCAAVDTPDPASRHATGAEITLPATRQFAPAAAPAPQRSNANMAQDFLDLHFALESGRALPRMTRFEGPVTLRLAGTPNTLMSSDLDRLLTRIRREAGIDIRRVPATQAANITVQAIPRDDIRRVLPDAACFVVPNVTTLDEYRSNRRSNRINWAAMDSRETVGVFIPNDTSPQDIRDCLHEEIAQALGPLNDLYRLPDSVFNDDNVHAVLTGFDMLMLRLTYAPELRSGMTRDEVAERLPALLNRFNPAGRSRPVTPVQPTPRSWTDPIHRVLGPGVSFRARRKAAREALETAQALGWTDHRRAFSHYLYGRLVAADDPANALRNYRQALEFLKDVPTGGLHAAFIIAQTSGYAVAQDQTDLALQMIAPAARDAKRGENAALLSVLLLTKAEALAIDGQTTSASNARSDALGWARYGFGTEWAARAGLEQVARNSARAAEPAPTRSSATPLGAQDNWTDNR